MNSSNNDLTSSEKIVNKLKPIRIEQRRKTNPENEKNWKIILNTKKQEKPYVVTPECDTPKTVNWSSQLSSQNESKKENIGINNVCVK